LRSSRKGHLKLTKPGAFPAGANRTKTFHESRAYDRGAHVFPDIFSHLAPASISSRARTRPCGLSQPRVRSRGSLAPIGWGKGDELDFPPGPVCWYVFAPVSGLGSARGLVRVGWDRGAQTEPCQKPRSLTLQRRGLNVLCLTSPFRCAIILSAGRGPAGEPSERNGARGAARYSSGIPR
jgi:hypothetical protein